MDELRESSGNAPRSTDDAGHMTAFGDVRFNVESGELHRDGRTTRLTPKAAAVLAALLEKAPGLVTKEELLNRVWDGRAVGDEAIASCVQEVRRALDDDARNPRYIETRHRRGYRLLAALDAKRVAKRLGALGAGVPDLALPDKPSIAVLPFQNLSGDPEQEYFTDGITEDIITELSRFSSLFVIARNSSFSYKGKSPDVREIGRELGVRYVLEGSIRKSLSRIRVTVQLIDTLTGNHIWAERYDRVIKDIFAVQEEVTRAIVAAIAPEIESTEQSKAARRRPDSLNAHEIALRATAHSYEAVGKADQTLVERAIREAREALAIDPMSVRALQVLSHAHGTALLLKMAMDREQALEQATWAATRAIELDRSNAVAYALRALAILRSSQINRYPDALADARRAHQLNPNDVEVLRILASLETGVGEHEQAIAHAEQALRLSPRDSLSYITFGLLAFVTFGAKQYAESVDWASRALNNMPGMVQAHSSKAAGLVGMGEIDKAKTVFAEQASVNRPGPGNWLVLERGPNQTDPCVAPGGEVA
jgi:TolB-like protein/Tfp pilus assembly protein PilF